MESNKYKIPDLIITSLFGNDKMKKEGFNELDNYLTTKITNKDELRLVLESFKADLFENPEYKNSIIQGDNINPIFLMLDAIQKYNPEPKLYFILFKSLFDLYKTNLDPKQIINFTDKIVFYLANKTKIVLSNFNDLFEILILLKISPDKDVKDSDILDKLDRLLKKSLKKYSDNIDLYKDYFDFDSFYNKIN